MASEKTLTGHCLCGAVEIVGTPKDSVAAVCHCDMCRHWSSGPFFEVSCEKVAFKGESYITKFRSSDWAERAFCKQCGTNLFYHIIDSSEFQVSVGILDDQSGLPLTLQVFIDSKPPYYSLAERTETMTGAEVYAQYAPSSD